MRPLLCAQLNEDLNTSCDASVSQGEVELVEAFVNYYQEGTTKHRGIQPHCDGVLAAFVVQLIGFGEIHVKGGVRHSIPCDATANAQPLRAI
jgi:hypothetical protein